ncbi:hypothetical protein DL98DRAFT_436799 [Cadophora sp. DSE1049]|nr:hypothetical protein DL98DRAFT_436799 [Cadophora sp. DSE1049]
MLSQPRRTSVRISNVDFGILFCLLTYSRFELFFSKIQTFLPLLHRSKLYAHIFDFQSHPEKQLRILDIPTALLLNSMFALSARFSNWDQFRSLGLVERGARFFRKAQALLSQHMEHEQEPTLRMLQIHILLTYYQLISGPSFQAWQATGVCCRMAYSLSLHHIDRRSTGVDSPAAVADSEWVLQEEKRRAWWAVFQMDNFASSIACRPYNIDASRMEVLLPISDTAWISNQRPKSALLSSKGPSEIWKSLQGCENQDVYAWYLVCNALVRVAEQMYDKPDCPIEDLKILQSALNCFALGLPPNFHLTGSNMMFDDHNFPEKNWVICTVILLQV